MIQTATAPEQAHAADVPVKRRHWLFLTVGTLLFVAVAMVLYSFVRSADAENAPEVSAFSRSGTPFLPVIQRPASDRPAVRIVPPGVEPHLNSTEKHSASSDSPAGTTRSAAVQILLPSPAAPLETSGQEEFKASTQPRRGRSLDPSLKAQQTDPNPQIEERPSVMPTATATATASPTPAATETPTATPTSSGPPPTPYVEVVNNGAGLLVDLHTGPGTNYPVVAKLGPKIPIAIDGRNPEGTWNRICCINGDSFWIESSPSIQIGNSLREVSLFVPDLPPTPTPTPTFTSTPPPFERAVGPEYYPTNNEFLTIWAKIFVGGGDDEDPLEGYRLAVEFEDGATGTIERRANASGMNNSVDTYLVSAAEGAGNRVFFNYKYEYWPGTANGEQTALEMLGTGTWRIWLTNAEGTQLSETVSFTTDPGNPNREVYVGWVRVR